MSDDRLRDLERRFRETGSVEDEATWLKERVRVGELSVERLQLAGLCGQGGAALAAAGLTPVLLSVSGAAGLLRMSPGTIRSWLKKPTGLRGHRAGRRVLVDPFEVLAQASRPAARDPEHPWNWGRYDHCRALEATVSLLDHLQPSAGLRAAVALLGAAIEVGRALRLDLELAKEARRRAALVCLEQQLPSEDRASGAAQEPGTAQADLDAAARALLEAATAPALRAELERTSALSHYFVCRHGRAGGEQSRIALRRDVVPWLLGYGDPVWSRVQVRGGRIKITPEDLEG